MKLRREIANSILLFGTGGGLMALIIILITYFMGYNPYGKLSLFGMWVPVVIIVFGIKHIKDTYLGFEIGFLEGLWYGILIGLLYALSASIFIVLFHTLGGSVALDMHRTELVELVTMNKTIYLETMKMTEADYETLLNNNKNTSISDVAIDDFIKKNVGCFIVALISAVIMRKHLPKPEPIKK
jgi:hypothetical protein